MGVDVRFLKPFLTVAEKLSFTKAAEALDISQPRLSLVIKQLEQQVGVALFSRKPHNVRLTPAGEILLEEARTLNAALQQFDLTVRKLRDDARSRLRLGSPSFSRDLPVRVMLIEEFCARHPQVRLEIEDGYTPRLVEHLREGRLDLTLASAPFDQQGLDCMLLSTSTPVLAIPTESPLARLSAIGPEAVRGTRIAVFPKYIGQAYVETWYQPLEAAGAILTESNEPHYGTQLAFAARRRLCTILHRVKGQLREPNDGYADMVLRPIVGFELASRVFLVRRSGVRHPPAQWFWNLASDFVKAPEFA